MLERFKKQAVLPASLRVSAAEGLPEGWNRPSAGECRSLGAELYREVGRHHPLHGKVVATVARRPDRDDVLFFVESSEAPLAQVHLTWSRESSREWPFTEWFGSLEEWRRSQDEDSG